VREEVSAGTSWLTTSTFLFHGANLQAVHDLVCVLQVQRRCA
jgi:hypothetical protein